MCSNYPDGRTGPRRVGPCPPYPCSVYYRQQAGAGDGSALNREVAMEWNAVFLVGVAIAILVGILA